MPGSPCRAGSTWIPQAWGTPCLRTRPPVGTEKGRTERTQLEPSVFPQREATGAGTRRSPTSPGRAEPGGDDPRPACMFPRSTPIPGGPRRSPPRPAPTASRPRGISTVPGTDAPRRSCEPRHTRVHTHGHAHASTWPRAHPHARTRVCTLRPLFPGRAPDKAGTAAAPAVGG